jgi:transcription elongation factor GreB
MSRAFVKDDGGREQPLPRPVPDAPNYVTPRGYELLREALAAAESAGNERDARYYRERLASAIRVDPPARKSVVAFGASVVARDERGRELRLRIVGADEADPARGAIGWDSPIARALEGRRVGDRVTVSRPAGPIEYRIESIGFP